MEEIDQYIRFVVTQTISTTINNKGYSELMSSLMRSEAALASPWIDALPFLLTAEDVVASLPLTRRHIPILTSKIAVPSIVVDGQLLIHFLAEINDSRNSDSWQAQTACCVSRD